MSTQNDDSHDNAKLDNDAQTGAGPRMTRRRMLQATAATGTALALGPGLATADHGDETEYDPETEDLSNSDAVQNYVSTDRGNYALQTPSAREAAGLAYMFGPMGVVSATAAGATDPEHSTTDYIHEYVFGPFEVETEDPTEDVVDDTVYYELQDVAQTLHDLFTVLGNVDQLIPTANAHIEAETFKRRRNEVSRSTAKAEVKQSYKAEVMSTWEENYLRICEQAGIRATGVYSYHLAAQADNSDWSPTDRYQVNDYSGSSSSYYNIRDIQINSLIDGGNVELCDGSTVHIRLCNWEFDVNGDGETDGVQFLPYLDPSTWQDKISNWTWPASDKSDIVDLTATAMEWDQSDGDMAHLGIGYRSTNTSEWDAGSVHPMAGLHSEIEGSSFDPYARFEELLGVLDSEVEKYVDTVYDNVAPEDIPNPENRGPGSLAYEAGIDWAKTGETGLSAFLKMSLGNYGSERAATIDVYRETDAANVTDSTEPDETYSSAWLSVENQGEVIEETDGTTQVLYDDTVTLNTIGEDARFYHTVTGDAADDGATVQTIRTEAFTYRVENDTATDVTVETSDGTTVSATLSTAGDGSGAMTADIDAATLQDAAGDAFTVANITIDHGDGSGGTASTTVSIGGDVEIVDNLDSAVSSITGLEVGKPYNVDGDAVGDATVYVEDGGAELNSPDAFVIAEYLDANGDPLNALPLSTYGVATLDNTNINSIYERWAAAADDYSNRDGSDAGDGVFAGGAGGGLGGLDSPLVLALGGGVAALLAALGISGAGDGGES